MKIKLNREWLGHPVDSILDLRETVSLELIRRGTAESVEQDKEERKEEKMKEKEQKEEPKVKEESKMKEDSKNKMMKRRSMGLRNKG